MDALFIIIPIKQSIIKKDCFIRLYYNCSKLYRLGVNNVLVADATTNFIFQKINRKIVESFGFIYMSFPDNSFYTPGTLKNKAATYAFNTLDRRYILFLDVDVFLNEKTLGHLNKNIRLDIAFDWLPVLFLKRHLKYKKIFKVKNIIVRPDDVVQIGYSTGIQFFSRTMFEKIGGYNEQYKGYGCEDIEMIHKGSFYLGIRKIDNNNDYYIDFRNHNPALLKGFRASYYSYRKDFSIENMPLHIWHKRKNKSDYLTRRVENDILLKKEMVYFDKKKLTTIASGED